MYGRFTYMYYICFLMVNVGKYTIHASYGYAYGKKDLIQVPAAKTIHEMKILSWSNRDVME